MIGKFFCYENLLIRILVPLFLKNTYVILTGLGSNVIHPIGCYHTHFKIQNNNFEIDIFVIKDNLISFDANLRQAVLQQSVFLMSKTGVKLIKNIISDHNFRWNYVVPEVFENFYNYSTLLCQKLVLQQLITIK